MTETKGAELNESQKKFCREYIFDFNGTRAYMAAYPESSYNAASVSAYDLLRKPNIKDYIKEIQDNLEEQAGISQLMVLFEQKKLAFSSIAHLHNTWIDRKELDSLSNDQKACISEISTQVRRMKIKGGAESIHEEDVDVEFVKIKLYDKQRALEAISKMLGYNAPDKVDHTSGGEQITGMIIK